MRTDTYTKTILTLIGLSLAVIALRPFARPIEVRAQGQSLEGVQYIPASTSFNAFAPNGAVYLYSYEGGAYSAKYLGQIYSLGAPMKMPTSGR
jgi:hypothetical protein